MVKNAGKLYYPIQESIQSVLPVVDEFVVALGDCDPEDNTLELIKAINSPKIKIVDTVWDVKAYPRGSILAQQTDVAKSHCTGDWLFYLQADEVIHEKDHAAIREACQKYHEDEEVEGLLFRYIHFWGDYNHAFSNHHTWYRNEIRIIRNKPEIHSWRDAQSFRVIKDFSKEKYLGKEDTRKLNVARVNAHVYHYGWVRPPQLMGKKTSHFESCYKDDNTASEELEVISSIDFGPMGKVPKYSGGHPEVMRERIQMFNWEDELDYGDKFQNQKRRRHHRLKYKLLTKLENMFFSDGLFTFKNYRIIRS